MKRLYSIGALWVCTMLSGVSWAWGEPAAAPQPDMGEFSAWKVKIPRDNYAIIRNGILIFGTRWGETPQTAQDLEDRTWEQLVLSYEAFRRGVEVDPKELEEEIDKTLKAEKLDFDWKKDKKAYGEWVKKRLNEPVTVFESQIKHLLQLESLRKKVLEEFSVTVSDEEAHQEFLNEYNTLELELAQFDEKVQADEFYKKMKKKPSEWGKLAQKDPKYFKKPGFVSLEFLMFMWKIGKDDLYAMLNQKEGTLYPAAPIYKGYGVFKIIKKRVAEEKDFSPRKDSYVKQVEMQKKYEKLKTWLKDLKNQAGIIVYPERKE